LFNLSRYNRDGDRLFCPYCQKCVKADFCSHLDDCQRRFEVRTKTVMPKEKTFMKFENHANKLERPFFVTADFESSLKPTGEEDCEKFSTKSLVVISRYRTHPIPISM